MRSRSLAVTAALFLVLGMGCSRDAAPVRAKPLKLRAFDAGAFTIEIPEGWPLVTAGQCSSLAFLVRDPADPLRQVFYFGQVGPVYEFESGFYDRYKLNPQQYRLSDLQPLPDGHHDLWTAPTLDGAQHL